MTDKPTDLDPLLAAAAKRQQAKTGGKGSVRKALAPQTEFLRQALELELTLTTVRDLLKQREISVSLSGLRAYLLEFLHDEYTSYLTTTGRGYKSTRTGVSLAKPEKKNSPTKLESKPAEPIKPTQEKQVSETTQQAGNDYASKTDILALADKFFPSKEGK